MPYAPQLKILATYMRGGTSKGVFFNLEDLPIEAQVAGTARDTMLLRVIGSPDPYSKHTDGMGGATSSNSKIVILSKSSQPHHDVDYLFGQVAIDKAFVDWSGNCGNLTTAVGSFGITNGLVDEERIPQNGYASVRIWQANIQKTIIAKVPITNNAVQETGNFTLDGVTFPAAEIDVAFVKPIDDNEAMFPTGNLVDDLHVPNVGILQDNSVKSAVTKNTAIKTTIIKTTMINAGIPTIFINAEDIHYTGTESQETINNDVEALAMFETIRAHGALKMGLINTIEEAASRQHTPKIAFVAPPASYTSSSGKAVAANEIDLLVRALSMGKLHHAMMSTAAVAIGTAAAIPGTLVNLATRAHLAASGEELCSEKMHTEEECKEESSKEKPENSNSITFGHPSGTLKVGAETEQHNNNKWTVNKVMMSRSARVLMEGWVRTPPLHY